MPQFIESPRFPDNIAYGSAGGPGFKTFVFEGASGVEQRTQSWALARGKWDVSYGIRDKDDMDVVRAFFYEMRGKAVGFRFKDWGDFELTNGTIGTGDGADATWQLIKTYGATNPYSRTLYKIVAGTLSVTVNNVPVTVGAGPTEVAVNLNTGLLTFGASAIPGSGLVIRATCEFDVPVRFDTDQMASSHDGWNTESWQSIPIVELREEDLA